MFDYQFIPIKTKGFFSFGLNQDYHRIIKEQSKMGWRFCQIDPTKWDTHGRWQEIEIVLERPANWEEEAAFVFGQTDRD